MPACASATPIATVAAPPRDGRALTPRTRSPIRGGTSRTDGTGTTGPRGLEDEDIAVHNLSHGPMADVTHNLATLRAAELEMPAAPHVDLAPGIFFVCDPDKPVTGTVRSAPGSMVTLDLQVPEGSRWRALHVRLAQVDLTASDVLMAVLRLRADGYTAARMVLRSGTGAAEGPGFVDSFFLKRVVAQPDSALHLDWLELGAVPDLPAKAPWRELIVFLDPADMAVEIEDLQLIVA